MSDDLPNKKKLVPISEAARVLGVSIDTIRRWDKSGVLHSSRPDGKNRYFSIVDLENLKFSKPYSISEAAKYLGISQSTLRRIEARGLIAPERNNGGERVYDRQVIEKFLHSEYFLRQKAVQEKILQPFKEQRSEEKEAKEVDQQDTSPSTETKNKILGIIVEENREQISSLMRVKKVILSAGLVSTALSVLLIIVLTIMFLVFTDETAEFFGYKRNSYFESLTYAKPAQGNKILGATYNRSQILKKNGEVLGKALKPLSDISLALVKNVNPQVYARIVPQRLIEDVNDILTIDEQGNITPLYNFALEDSSYLKVPDTGLVENLNASWLRGKTWGDQAGDLVLYSDEGTIENLAINTGNIVDGAVTTEKLAEGIGLLTDDSVLSKHIKDGEVTGADIKNDTIKNEDIADKAINSAKIEDGTVSSDDLKDGSVTSVKISDNTITTSDLAGTLTFADGDFLDLSAIVYDDNAVQGLRLPNASSASPTSPSTGEGFIAWDTSGNQLIVYNGSSWGTVTGGSGSQTPWTSNIDADGYSLTDFGTALTASGALTISTTTSSALTLDSGTTGTVNLGTGSNAKTINIGTGTAGNTINIGTNNTTLDTIAIGSALDSLALTDADWSITSAGAAAFASVTEGGTALSSKYAPISSNFITVTANGTLTGETGIDALSTAISTSSTLNVDSTSTLNAVTLDANANLTFSSGTGSLVMTNAVTNASDKVIELIPSYTGGATDTLTYTVIDIAAFTADNSAGTDTVNGLSFGNLTQSGAGAITASAIKVGTGWDDILNYNGTSVINGSGQVAVGQLNGTLFTAAGDSGGGRAITSGNVLTIAGGTNLTSVDSDTDTVTINLDDSITLAGDLTVQGQNVNFDSATDIDLDAATAAVLTISAGSSNFLSLDSRTATSGVVATTLTGIAPTLASAAGGEYTTLSVSGPIITFSDATNPVTSLMETVTLAGSTITNSLGAHTVDKATTLSLVAPVDSTNTTITDNSALRILNVTSGAGTLTNQYGLYVEDLTSGATADYGVYIAGADSYAIYAAADDVAILDDLWVGATSETIVAAGFSLDNDDAFINGLLGVEGTIYTDTGLDVNNSTLTINSSGNISTSGTVTAATDETINGIDISSGSVSDVSDLALLLGAGNDFTIDATTTPNTTTTGVIDLNVGTVTNNNIGLNLDYTINDSAGITGYASTITATIADDTGHDSTVYGLRILGDIDDLTGTSTLYGLYIDADNDGGGQGTEIAIETRDGLVRFGDGTDYAQFSTVGDITFVDADGSASITGPAGGALGIAAANSQALNLTTTTAGNISLDPAGAGDITLVTDGASGSYVNVSGLSASSGTSLCVDVSNNIVTCSSGSSAATLQNAYNNGNSIETASNNAVIITETTGTAGLTGDLFQLTFNQAATGTTSGDALQITLDGTEANAVTGHGIHMIIDQSQISGNAILVEDDQGTPETLFQLTDDGALTLGTVGATTAITITDSSYTNSLSIADNNITGTTAAITLTDFSLDADGLIAFTSDGAGDQLSITTPAADFQALVVDGTTNDSTQTAGMIDLNIDSSTDTAVLGLYLSGTSIADNGADTLYGNRIDFTVASDVGASGSDTIYGEYISLTVTDASSTGTGLYVDAGTGAGTEYAAVFLNGNVGIGDSSPSAPLEIGDGTDSIQFSSVGDITFVDANGAATITGPAGGALNINAANSQALALATTTAGNITFSGAGTGDYSFAVDSDSVITVTGGVDGTDAISLPAGDILLTDGDLDLLGGDFNVALDAGDGINITKVAAPTVDVVTINSGISATAGVDALQVTFDSSNASGNAIDITLSSIDGNGSDTTIVIDIDAFSYTSSAGTDTVKGLSIGTLTESGTVTSTAIDIGTGWDSDLNAGTSLEIGIGGTNELVLNATDLSPATSDGSALGTGLLMWADLFLANASVINLNNGDVTLTHGANLLTLAGGDLEIGTNTLSGSTAVINFTDFDVSSDGLLVLAPDSGVDADLNYMDVQTPAIIATAATTVDVYGISSAGALTTTADASAETLTYRAINLTLPNMNTAEAGDSTVVTGLLLTPGTITNGSGTETVTGVDIGNITGGSGTDTALNIGTGWDVDLNFADTTAVVRVADGTSSTITIEDSAGNDILVLADTGGSSAHTLTGDSDTGFTLSGITTLTASSLTAFTIGASDLQIGTGDVNFTATGGSSGNADVDVDGYLQVGGTAELDGALQADGAATFNSTITANSTIDVSLATTEDIDLTIDPGTEQALVGVEVLFDGQDDTTGADEDQVALTLNQTSNGADTSEAADALLSLVNNDANDPVNVGIRFEAGAAGTDFSDGISFALANVTREIVLENGEAIIGQSADTITFEDDDGTDYATLTATALTVTGDLAITGGNITTALTADSTLTVTGTTTTNGTLTANGVVTLGDNGDTVAINSSDWDITTVGDATGIGALTMDGNFSQTGATTFSTGTGAITLNGAVTGNTDVDLTLLETENFGVTNTVSGTNALDLVAITLTDTTTSGTQRGMVITKAANATDGTTEALLVLDNAETTANILTDYLLITKATTGPDTTTDAIDVSDPDLGVALRVDANDIIGTTGVINYTNFDVDANGNITVAGAQGLDTNAAGTLEIGLTNANALILGNETSATSVEIDSGTGSISIGNAIAKTINIGNATGATLVNIDSGTGGVTIDSTSTGDIVINSTDTLLLDSAGVLELNSSGGIISIGNDAVAQNINIGTGAASRVITIGNATANTAIALTTAGTGDLTVTTGDDILLLPTDDVTLTAAAGTRFLWDGTTTDSTENTSATAGIFGITIDDALADTASGVQQGLYLDFQVTNTADVNAMTHRAARIDFTYSEDSSTDSAYVLSLNNANDAVTTTIDGLLSLENNDTTAASVDNGIVFLAGGAATPDFADGIDFSAADFTREIVLENGEAIIGQSADTITFEDDDGTDYATLTATALTVTGDLAITGGNITTAVTADSTLTVTGNAVFNGNTTIGNANSDTLTINAGTSGTGISFGDVTFQACTALETSASGVLTCGSDAGGNTIWSDIGAPTTSLSLTFDDTGTAETTTFTSSANTETFFTMTGNSLTSGKILGLTSTATAFTGELASIVLSGSNAANTGSLLAIDNTGTLNTNTSLYIKHYATGTNNLAFRIDDVSGDTTPFVIDGGGSVGIGTTTPGALLHLGSFSESESNALLINGTITSTGTGQQSIFQNQPAIDLQGASVTSLYGLINLPTIDSTVNDPNITNAYGAFSRIDTNAGYAGTITNGISFGSSGPTLSGTNKITNFYQFSAGAAGLTNSATSNSGNTSGTITNVGFIAGAYTAEAGSGGTLNNYAAYFNVPNGDGTAGTTNNYGLRVTGNSSAGDTNYALYIDSTTDSYFAGQVGINNTAPATTLEVGNTSSTADEGITVSTTEDAFLTLTADVGNSGEDDNPYIAFNQDGSTVQGLLGFVGNAGVDPQNATYTGTLTNALMLGTLDSLGAIQFGTNDNVRMTIEPGGDIGIGTTAPTLPFVVSVNSAFRGDFLVDRDGTTATTPHSGTQALPVERITLTTITSICVDNITNHREVYQDGNGDCIFGNGGTDNVLEGSTPANATTVATSYAFNDADTDCNGDTVTGDAGCTASDGIYQVGQDIFYDSTPPNVYTSAMIQVGLNTDPPTHLVNINPASITTGKIINIDGITTQQVAASILVRTISSNTSSVTGFQIVPELEPTDNTGTGLGTTNSLSVLGSKNITSTLEANRSSITLNSAYTGTVTTAIGYRITTPTVSGGTLTNVNGIRIDALTTGTNQAGIVINNATSAGNDTNLLIGTTTIPSGDYSIYNVSTKDNYFGGDFGIGDNSPEALFDVGSGTARTEDLVTFISSGATITDGINGLFIAFTQGDDADATDTNAGVNIAITGDSVDADTLYGIRIANLAGASGGASSTAISVGTSWDTVLGGSTAGTSIFDFTNFDVTTAGNITVAAAEGLDVNGAGALEIGDTTATTVAIGTTAATTLNIGNNGALTRTINIGTGTGVDTINIGTGATGADVISIGTGASGSRVQFFDNTSAPTTTSWAAGHFAIGATGTSGTSGRIWIKSGTTNYTIKSTLASVADYSEFMMQDEPGSSEPGDVMVMSNSGSGKVKKGASSYNPQIVGAVTTNVRGTSNNDLDYDDFSGTGSRAENKEWANVGMLGQVYVKVSMENGEVRSGDPITSSSELGVAMRASKSGRILGWALQSWDGSQTRDKDAPQQSLPPGVGIILAFVQPTWSEVGEEKLDTTSQLVNGILSYPEASIDKLVEQDQEITILGQDGLAAVHIDSSGNALFKGTITADRIYANQIEGLEIKIKDQILAINSEVLGTTQDASRSANLLSQNSEFAEGLATFSGKLAIDELEVKNISIFAGIAQFLESITTRNLIVTDWARFLAEVLFKGDVEFEGRVTFNKDSAGFAQIKKGADQVEVKFEKEYEQTPLVNASITLDDNMTDKDRALLDVKSLIQKEAEQEASESAVLSANIGYIVTRATVTGFVIKLNKPAVSDLKFSWSAIAVKDAKVAVGDEIVSSSNKIVEQPSPTPSPSPSPVLTPSPTPSPDSTGSLQATPVPAAPSEPEKRIRVSENELGLLRVRSEPSTLSEEVGQVYQDEIYIVLDQTQSSGQTWYKIEYIPGLFGWVSGAYITIQ